jgi:hypothetical protein
MSAVAMKFLDWLPPVPGRIRVLFVFGDDKFFLMFRLRRERIGGWRAEEKVALWLEVSRRERTPAAQEMASRWIWGEKGMGESCHRSAC